MSERIHQEAEYAVSASRIYEVLTRSDAFSQMSGGAPTEIDPVEGGAFSCFGGMIVGRNLECEPGKRLVQAWRVKTWEPGTYSIVRFELSEQGDGTRLVLDHTGFPEGQAEHLAQGWRDNYLDPLRAVLA